MIFLNKRSKRLTMQFNFHSLLWSYLTRVTIFLAMTVYIYIYIYKYMYTHTHTHTHSQYRRSLYAEYAVCVGHQLPGAPSQLLKKKQKKPDAPFPHPRPRPLTPHVCADDHNWWTAMPVKRHKQSGAEKREKKKKDEKKALTSFSGRLHS